MANKRVLGLCFLLVCATSLGKSQPTLAKRMQKSGTLSLTDSIHKFAEKLYQVSTDGQSANTVISPLSVFTTLLMTSVGARGSTLEQIERTLNISISDTVWQDKMTQLQKDIRASSSEDVTTEIANIMWVSKGIKIKADFFRSAANVFQTQVREADFNYPEPVREIVNKKISNLTSGLVDQLLPPGSITKETKMLLANALYFKGSWLHPFNESNTFNEAFFMENGRSVNVPMMHLSDVFRAGNLKDLDVKAIFLPYNDERHGLLCILPNRKSDLKGTESRLSASGYTPTKLLRRMIQRDVNVTLPKFKIRFDAEMTGTLKKMGIVDLFSDNADLSGLSSAALTSGLKVSQVYHQSTIEVNEGGSEAAAATAFQITPLMGGSKDDFGPIEFRADHPFLFYIIDLDNDQLPLFVGRLNNPSVDSIQTKSTSSIAKPAHQQPSVIQPEAPAETQEIPAASNNRAWLYNNRNPIVFPDSDRLKRSDTPATKNVTMEEQPLNQMENVDTRVKDSNWFNKPTAPQVFVPIKTTEGDRAPSKPFLRPEKTTSVPFATSATTLRPVDITISFSIFGNVPMNPPPGPPPGHPPAHSQGSNWGAPNEPQPFQPNFGPPTSSPFSIGWFQEHGNENFAQPTPNTNIRFPDFHFSSLHSDRKNFPSF